MSYSIYTFIQSVQYTQLLVTLLFMLKEMKNVCSYEPHPFPFPRVCTVACRLSEVSCEVTKTLLVKNPARKEKEQNQGEYLCHFCGRPFQKKNECTKVQNSRRHHVHIMRMRTIRWKMADLRMTFNGGSTGSLQRSSFRENQTIF